MTASRTPKEKHDLSTCNERFCIIRTSTFKDLIMEGRNTIENYMHSKFVPYNMSTEERLVDLPVIVWKKGRQLVEYFTSQVT